MISDSTGIPPRFAQPAGFAQDTYGTFDGPAPFGLYDKRDAEDLKHLFKSEPVREISRSATATRTRPATPTCS